MFGGPFGAPLFFVFYFVFFGSVFFPSLVRARFFRACFLFLGSMLPFVYPSLGEVFGFYFFHGYRRGCCL